MIAGLFCYLDILEKEMILRDVGNFALGAEFDAKSLL